MAAIHRAQVLPAPVTVPPVQLIILTTVQVPAVIITIIILATVQVLTTAETLTPVRDMAMAAQIVGPIQTPTLRMDRTPIVRLIQIPIVPMARIQIPTIGLDRIPTVPMTICPTRTVRTIGGSSGNIE